MQLEGIQLGHYQLQRLVGQGETGAVYLAADVRTAQQVVVKVLQIAAPSSVIEQDISRRYQQEMGVFQHLKNEHILPVLGAGEERVQQTLLRYIVMPSSPARSLKDWVKQQGGYRQISVETVVDLIGQAGAALQYAHDHYIRHLDIKPANILIRDNQNPPFVLLTDFAMVKVVEILSKGTGQPAPDMWPYMAPEVWEHHPVAASDQYSLAVVAFELLTGRCPFQGDQSMLANQHLTASPPPPHTLDSRVPPSISGVILHALSKRPEARFSSVSDFTGALLNALTFQKKSAPPTPIPGVPATPLPTQSAPLPQIPMQQSPQGYVQQGPAQKDPVQQGYGRQSTVPQGAAQQAPGQNGGQYSTRGGMAPTPPLPGFQMPASLEQRPWGENIALAPWAQPGGEISPYRRETMRKQRVARAVSLGAFLGIFLLLCGVASFGAFEVHTYQVHVAAAAAASRATAIARDVAATVKAAPPATATSIVAHPDPYSAGILTLYDPLNQPVDWNNGANSSFGGTCQFTAGTYQVKQTKSGRFYVCEAPVAFSNFAFQVQMTIVQGNCGGLIFRDRGNINAYVLFVCQDGTYMLERYDGPAGQNATSLSSGSDASIKTGLKATNTIAILADGSTLSVYINNTTTPVAAAQDSRYSHGAIGVLADDDVSSTAVTYRNARVWTF